MIRRRSWIHVGTALGVIGALLVVSPALGGPSLQSLVKKEVAKQYAAAQVSKKKKKPAGINVVQRTATLGPLASGASGEAIATCVGKEKATGGGYAAQVGFGRVDGSRAELTGGVPTGWRVSVGNDSGAGGVVFVAYVLCTSTK
jgi:hypothetical protein